MQTYQTAPEATRPIVGPEVHGRNPLLSGIEPIALLKRLREPYNTALLALVATYLGVWLVNFPNVYGWIMDDLVVSYTKGMLTTADWKAAFGGYNALQPYFYLISYLPLKLPFSLSSYPLPPLGDGTGHFRFLLLYMVLVHALLLLMWGVFARLIASPLPAFLSVVLFATSPTLTLWTPQPESRLVGLPFVLVGFALLLRSPEAAHSLSKRNLALMFLVGSLLWLGQSLHYTSLYVIIPFCVAYWGLMLVRGWRTRAYWFGMSAFIAGCIWLQGVLELVSYFILRIPLSSGPTATLLKLREIHSSVWTTLGNLELWRDWFVSQFGLPLIIATLIGWALYTVDARRRPPSERMRRLTISLTLVVAVAYFAFTGTDAFFRQTSVLQPFLFAVAATGIVILARRFTRRPWQYAVAVAGLVGVCAFVPWSQAYHVFEADQGLGRAMNWINANRGDRTVAWLRIAWFGDPVSITSPEELEHLSPDTWLVSYYPWNMVEFHPSFQSYLDATPPVAEWPSLYSTDTMHTELTGYGYNDFRFDPLLSQIRVTRVGDILARMHGQPLAVSAVTADSGTSDPVNVFDNDASPDNLTAWVSADSPGPHWLEIDLKQLTVLDAMDVVLPPTDKSTERIAQMDVEVEDPSGNFHDVWSQADLENFPVIHVTWSQQPVAAIRLTTHAQAQPWGPVGQVTVEEIVFPGFSVSAPPPQRTFAPLSLASVNLTESGVEVTGDNITSSTSLRIGAVDVPTVSIDGRTHLTARISPDLVGHELSGPAMLVDPFRQSNTISVDLKPPRLDSVAPSSVEARGNNVIITAMTENALPGTVILFDSQPLETAFGNPQLLTAKVPQAFIEQPGRHMISVRNVLGASSTVELNVAPPRR